MNTYRFTIRPACSAHCPDGWASITPLAPSEPWNYGTVAYEEPLGRAVAEHWSLIPLNRQVPLLRFDDGRIWHLTDLLGEAGRDLAYEYGSGLMARADLEAAVARQAQDYGVTVEIAWPPDAADCDALEADRDAQGPVQL